MLARAVPRAPRCSPSQGAATWHRLLVRCTHLGDGDEYPAQACGLGLEDPAQAEDEYERCHVPRAVGVEEDRQRGLVRVWVRARAWVRAMGCA
eukprot:scaffold45579_cov67-Phaeocystis_antarctica.AAC.5